MDVLPNWWGQLSHGCGLWSQRDVGVSPTPIMALFLALLKLSPLGEWWGVHLALGSPGFTQAVLPALRYWWTVTGLRVSAGF